MGHDSTVERFLTDVVPRLAAPDPTHCEDGSYHVGAFKVAAIRHGLAFGKVGEQEYEIVRGDAVVGRLRGMVTDLVHRDVIELCANKARTIALLTQAGVPAPNQRAFRDSEFEAALASARGLDFSIVVKPCFGAGGRGVSTAISGEEDFRSAWAHAVANLAPKRAPRIVVESRCPGMDIRAVVVAGRFNCAATRMPANVVGDGQSTVSALIARKNRARATHIYHARYPIVVDERLANGLRLRGMTLETVVPADMPVVLAEVNNIHAGGEACEITDLVPRHIRTIAEQAARAVPGLAVVGVDLMVTSLDDDAEVAVIEMNPRANFSVHYAPYRGRPQNPAIEIVRVMLDAAAAAGGRAAE